MQAMFAQLPAMVSSRDVDLDNDNHHRDEDAEDDEADEGEDEDWIIWCNLSS